MMARALHYVFKIGDRKATYDFYTKVLQMKVLRHEEFEDGCKAECNGPFNGKWSKTMIGYGSEDDNFVIELTYNYEIGGYTKGNDFNYLHINSSDVYYNIKKLTTSKTGGLQFVKNMKGCIEVKDPDGYAFRVSKTESPDSCVDIASISTTDLKKSVDYWKDHLGMEVVKTVNLEAVLLQYGKGQCKLELCKIEGPLDRGSSYGRIAFSCPTDRLKEIEKKSKSEGYKILKDLVTLETPGKADVVVVILADPMDHEICFVGDEGFRELSKIDPKADELIRSEIEKDDSNEWFKNGKKKV